MSKDGEGKIINGYISFTQVSQAGKHLVCTLIDESQPEHRFSLLESPDANVPTGTTVVNGVFEYARTKDGELAEPEWHETEGGKFCYHVGYLVEADEIKRGSGNRGKLASMLAELDSDE